MGVFSKKDPGYELPKRPITVSTGNVNRDYEILDAIFAVDFSAQTWVKAADPSKSFEGVKTQLQDKCRDMGGDAVICCQFQYRISINDDILRKQVAEIWAYGTAVKFI